MRLLLLAALLLPGAPLRSPSPGGEGGQGAPGFSQPDAARHPDLFLWTDTCNVWVIKDGDAALLIDLGDGSVLPRLADIGVKTVEWVLFTHHHREQCQGAPKLPKGVKIGVNQVYPTTIPLVTLPAKLLAKLPVLPEVLEYRLVDHYFLLRDRDANLIIDVLPKVYPTRNR